MLRDNLTGLIEPMFSSAGAYPLALCTDRNKSSDDRPQHALKIPARQGGIYALTENVTSPFHAEPRQLSLLMLIRIVISPLTNSFSCCAFPRITACLRDNRERHIRTSGPLSQVHPQWACALGPEPEPLTSTLLLSQPRASAGRR